MKKANPTANAVDNAVWTTAYINDLPDSAFLFIEGGGKKDSEGKTTPRSLRHFPYKDKSGKVDLPHLRNALARIPQSKVSDAAKSKATAKAQKLLKATKTRNVSNSYQEIVRNIKPVVRHDTMENKPFLVVPTIMMTTGVHNGSDGPLYYPKDELAKTPEVWNHKPVVVYHPEINGKCVSACDPTILTARKVGVLMNTVFEDNKLKTEVWLEEERANKVDSRIAKSLASNSMMEVSTGLFTDCNYEDGTFGDEPYVAVAKNLRPDHLALLPDKVGACSIEDGAGFLRVNAEKDADDAVPKLWSKDFFQFLEAANINTEKLVPNEMGHESLRRLLSSELREKDDEAYIEEVYDEYLIYEKGGALYKQMFEVEEGAVKFTGIAEQVVRVVEYRTATGVLLGNERRHFFMKGKVMDKEKFIGDLIANETTRFTEDDKDWLTKQDEATLEKLMPNEKQAVTVNSEKDDKKKTETKSDAGKAETDTTTQNVDEYVDNAPPEMRDMLKSGLASHRAEKKRLINTITANKKNTFTEEQLNSKGVDELKAIAKLAVTEEQEKQLRHTPIYDGLSETTQNVENTVGELPIPQKVMTAEAKKD